MLLISYFCFRCLWSSHALLKTPWHREMQFKMMYMGFKSTSSTLSSHNIALSVKLLKVLIVTVLFEWPFVNHFWVKECKEMSLILKKDLAQGAILCILLKTLASLNLSSSSLKPLEVLLLSARKCVPLQWIPDTAPTVPQWIQSTVDITPLKARSFGFFHIWDPFLDYIGSDKAQTLNTGIDWSFKAHFYIL